MYRNLYKVDGNEPPNNSDSITTTALSTEKRSQTIIIMSSDNNLTESSVQEQEQPDHSSSCRVVDDDDDVVLSKKEQPTSPVCVLAGIRGIMNVNDIAPVDFNKNNNNEKERRGRDGDDNTEQVKQQQQQHDEPEERGGGGGALQDSGEEEGDCCQLRVRNDNNNNNKKSFEISFSQVFETIRIDIDDANRKNLINKFGGTTTEGDYSLTGICGFVSLLLLGKEKDDHHHQQQQQQLLDTYNINRADCERLCIFGIWLEQVYLPAYNLQQQQQQNDDDDDIVVDVVIPEFNHETWNNFYKNHNNNEMNHYHRQQHQAQQQQDREEEEDHLQEEDCRELDDNDDEHVVPEEEEDCNEKSCHSSQLSLLLQLSKDEDKDDDDEEEEDDDGDSSATSGVVVECVMTTTTTTTTNDFPQDDDEEEEICNNNNNNCSSITFTNIFSILEIDINEMDIQKLVDEFGDGKNNIIGVREFISFLRRPTTRRTDEEEELIHQQLFTMCGLYESEIKLLYTFCTWFDQQQQQEEYSPIEFNQETWISFLVESKEKEATTTNIRQVCDDTSVVVIPENSCLDSGTKILEKQQGGDDDHYQQEEEEATVEDSSDDLSKSCNTKNHVRSLLSQHEEEEQQQARDTTQRSDNEEEKSASSSSSLSIQPSSSSSTTISVRQKDGTKEEEEEGRQDDDDDDNFFGLSTHSRDLLSDNAGTYLQEMKNDLDDAMIQIESCYYNHDSIINNEDNDKKKKKKCKNKRAILSWNNNRGGSSFFQQKRLHNVLETLLSVFKMMNNNGNSPTTTTTTVDQVISILVEFCQGKQQQDYSNATMELRISYLLHGLRRHEQDCIIQGYGFHILIQLASNNNNNRISVVQAGGFDFILEMMNKHMITSSSTIQTNGCHLLSILVQDESSQKVIIGKDGGDHHLVSTIVLAMEQHLLDVKVQESACNLLLNVAQMNKNNMHQIIFVKEGISAVLAALQQHSSCSTLCQKAGHVLVQLGTTTTRNISIDEIIEDNKMKTFIPLLVAWIQSETNTTTSGCSACTTNAHRQKQKKRCKFSTLVHIWLGNDDHHHRKKDSCNHHHHYCLIACVIIGWMQLFKKSVEIQQAGFKWLFELSCANDEEQNNNHFYCEWIYTMGIIPFILSIMEFYNQSDDDDSNIILLQVKGLSLLARLAEVSRKCRLAIYESKGILIVLKVLQRHATTSTTTTTTTMVDSTKVYKKGGIFLCKMTDTSTKGTFIGSVMDWVQENLSTQTSSNHHHQQPPGYKFSALLQLFANGNNDDSNDNDHSKRKLVIVTCIILGCMQLQLSNALVQMEGVVALVQLLSNDDTSIVQRYINTFWNSLLPHLISIMVYKCQSSGVCQPNTYDRFIPIVITAMEQHYMDDNIKLHEDSCKFLSNSSWRNEHTCKIILDSNGIAIVMMVMKKHFNSIKLHEYSCKLLGNLVYFGKDDNNYSKEIVKQNGIQIIMEIIQQKRYYSYHNHVALQQCILCLLTKLAYEKEENCKTIVFMNNNIISTIIEMMERHSSNVQLQENASTLLGTLACYGGVECCKIMIGSEENVVIPTVVEIMQENFSHAEVQNKSCWLLGNLLYHSSSSTTTTTDCCRDIVTSNGISAVVMAMKLHIYHEQLFVTSSHLLATLLSASRTTTECQNEIVSANIIPTVVDAMQKHMTCCELQQNAIFLLSSLTCCCGVVRGSSSSHSSSVVGDDIWFRVIPTVVEVSCKHLSNMNVQQNVCMFLGNLVVAAAADGSSSSYCRAIFAANGIPTIIAAMKQHEGNTQIQQLGCRAFKNLVVECCSTTTTTTGNHWTEFMNQQMANSQVIAVLVSAMKRHNWELNIILDGCHIFQCIAERTSSRKRRRQILEQDGVLHVLQGIAARRRTMSSNNSNNNNNKNVPNDWIIPNLAAKAALQALGETVE